MASPETPESHEGHAGPLASRQPCIETDALIVGAGPVGLFQVFQLGLLEIKAHVIEALPYAGGQCAELYADKPIYDIPAIDICTGAELTQRLLKQIAPFEATFHFGQQVSTLKRQPDGRWRIETTQGARFLAKTVFIAAGVGAFVPRKLAIDGLERFTGTQLSYRFKSTADYADQRVLIVGGDEAAIDAALRLCDGMSGGSSLGARSVTLLHRRNVLDAPESTLTTLKDRCDNQLMRFVVGQVSGFEVHEDRLSSVQVARVDGATELLATDALLVLLGLSPKLGPVAQWGLDMDRKQLRVNTESFATSEPGIFAIGDVNTYPGKKKLIVCGFHECVLAAFGAMRHIAPDKTITLQYTTSSPRLHKLLGVGRSNPD